MADLNQVREIQNALNVGIAAGVKQIYDKKQSREIVIKNVMSAGNFNQAQATKLVEQGGMFENKWKGTSSNGTHLSHEELKIVIQHLVTQVQSGKVDLNNLWVNWEKLKISFNQQWKQSLKAKVALLRYFSFKRHLSKSEKSWLYLS